MKKYKITYTDAVLGRVSTTTDDVREAQKLARQAYREGHTGIEVRIKDGWKYKLIATEWGKVD